ncbi:hypothetical protein D1164_07785 [Mariniphaga sediminis]|uniref:Uncharacterized protein n=1 Tax=Mariniphaga sediminis TaxID=1628158 RepID=A0A399D268_9BACT|nr:hypothetical protein D1164_07785 [Mariniphaga sediminis]
MVSAIHSAFPVFFQIYCWFTNNTTVETETRIKKYFFFEWRGFPAQLHGSVGRLIFYFHLFDVFCVLGSTNSFRGGCIF